jgi:Di-haem oxidoreductase, putative peroxidase
MMFERMKATIAGGAAFLSFGTSLWMEAQNGPTTAHDPGVRGVAVGAGQPLSTLSPAQLQFFQDGLSRFTQVDSVSGTIAGEPGNGLGPGLFATFMRFLAPPIPSAQGIPGNPPASSIGNGMRVFSQVHCDLCHTPVLPTGPSAFTAALSNQSAALFSDLLVHHMGSGLADQISQGSAGPDEFRTAPLWGIGQRIFFLHDGRATPANGGLLTAIEDHAGQGSEANAVINLFNGLSQQQKQDLLNFLRSL